MKMKIENKSGLKIEDPGGPGGAHPAAALTKKFPAIPNQPPRDITGPEGYIY